MIEYLAVAFGPTTRTPEFRVTLRSWARHRGDSRLVLFVGGDCDEDALAEADRLGARLQPVEHCRLDDSGNKQRHWVFLEYLAQQSRDARVFATLDARDTLFQADPEPFLRDYVRARRLGEDLVLVTAENARVQECPWNTKDQHRLGEAVRKPCRTLQGGWPIINGGFAVGPLAGLLRLQQLRFAVDLREGPGSDQATLTALVHWTSPPAWTQRWCHVVTPEDGFILHGHHASRTAVVDAQGLFVTAAGVPYPLVHQWDRLSYHQQRILQQYR